MLKGSERGVIDNEDLDACATRASEALIKFLKQEETCDEERDKDDGEEGEAENDKGKKKKAELDAAKLKKKMKDLGDLIGASASLCVAIRILVDLQVRLDVDVTTRNLTFAWETAAREKHREIDGRMLDLNNTGQLEDAFPESDESRDAGNWIRSWHLGAGSFESAGLYVQYSASGNITNRIVVKDCDYNQTKQTQRIFDEHDCLWTVDRNNAKIPMEVATMYDLREKPGSEYVVKILNWRMGPEGRRLFRLYIEVSSCIRQSMRNY
jgi:hypothetical protein